MYLSSVPPSSCTMSVQAVRYSFMSSTSGPDASFSENVEKLWMSEKYAVISASWPPSCGETPEEIMRLTNAGET